jgi:hypothetical protein
MGKMIEENKRDKVNKALKHKLKQYCDELNMLFPELEAHVSNAADTVQIIIRGKK